MVTQSLQPEHCNGNSLEALKPCAAVGSAAAVLPGLAAPPAEPPLVPGTPEWALHQPVPEVRCRRHYELHLRTMIR